jgi:deoxyribodipyrimidine photo-lyase
MFNPITQAKRFDPDGAYVRRHVPELDEIGGRAAHEPWKLGPLEREALGYPGPIVEHEEAVGRFRAARGRST